MSENGRYCFTSQMTPSIHPKGPPEAETQNFLFFCFLATSLPTKCHAPQHDIYIISSPQTNKIHVLERLSRLVAVVVVSTSSYTESYYYYYNKWQHTQKLHNVQWLHSSHSSYDTAPKLSPYPPPR